eukprot:4971208-Lingulodinium_polyedra.AAC.1
MVAAGALLSAQLGRPTLRDAGDADGRGGTFVAQTPNAAARRRGRSRTKHKCRHLLLNSKNTNADTAC